MRFLLSQFGNAMILKAPVVATPPLVYVGLQNLPFSGTSGLDFQDHIL